MGSPPWGGHLRQIDLLLPGRSHYQTEASSQSGVNFFTNSTTDVVRQGNDAILFPEESYNQAS